MSRRRRRSPRAPTGCSLPGTHSTEQRNRLGSEPFAAPRKAEAVGGRRANGDELWVDLERAREPVAHLEPVGREPRLLADQDHVRVRKLEPEPADALGGEAKQVE